MGLIMTHYVFVAITQGATLALARQRFGKAQNKVGDGL